jgi:hypothetical protein
MGEVPPVHPHYRVSTTQGPKVIESYLKKAKQSSAITRFFSPFTKRWFVLDLNKGTFQYSRAKNSSRGLRAYTLKVNCR